MFRSSSLRGDVRRLGVGVIGLVSLFAMGLAASNGAGFDQNSPVELVLIDREGDGLRLCPVEPAARVGFGNRHIEARAWTCVNDDDAVLLLVNPGRGPSIADVLGLKVGPENGFDHLALMGGGARRTEVDSSESRFKYLVLWTDSDADRTVRDTELDGLSYLGFDRLVLTSNRSDGMTLHSGVTVTRRGAAMRRGTPHEMVSMRFTAR